jgi:hypothetical protein
MLEIIILVLAGRHIASIARRKNRSPVGYVLLMVFGWYGAGLCGAFVGGIFAGLLDVPDGPDLAFIVVGFLVGAVSGLGVAYLVVYSVPPLRRPRGDYDDYEDYDDPPRRRDAEDEFDRRRERDEYDDRPRRRRDPYDYN